MNHVTQPRYSDRPLPTYAHTPGLTPHPVSDPAGHSHGEEPAPAAPLDPSRWRDSTDYLDAIDLFNHGYPWEAHEAWERLWIAAGRRGETADFLKGLIKLAAAAVKQREERPQGTRRHARRAAELLRQVPTERYAGLVVPDVIRLADRTAEEGRLPHLVELQPRD